MLLLAFAVALGVIVLFLATGRDRLKQYDNDSETAHQTREISMLLGISGAVVAVVSGLFALELSSEDWILALALAVVIFFGVVIVLWMKKLPEKLEISRTEAAELQKKKKQNQRVL